MEGLFEALGILIGALVTFVLFFCFIGFIIFFFVVLIIAKTSKGRSYRKSFDKVFKNFDTATAKGARGENVIVNRLGFLDGYKRIVSNCYIPKEDGTTTEVDVIMIHEKGIFVFESKNYSGWIFGTETQEKWVQCLRKGRRYSQKHNFYNPIMQNKTHIRWLKKYLAPLRIQLPFYSYIVFGYSCELKNITLTSNEHMVLRVDQLRHNVQNKINAMPSILTQQQVDLIYSYLINLTNVTNEQKQQHIQNIKSNFDRNNPAYSSNSDYISKAHNVTKETTARTPRKGQEIGNDINHEIKEAITSRVDNAVFDDVIEIKKENENNLKNEEVSILQAVGGDSSDSTESCGYTSVLSQQNKDNTNINQSYGEEESLIREDDKPIIEITKKTEDFLKPQIKEKINERICPRCGGTLVLRTSKNGERVGEKFFGCKNFPKCRYTSKC